MRADHTLALEALQNYEAGLKTSTTATQVSSNPSNNKQDKGEQTSNPSKCTHSKLQTGNKGNSVDCK